MENRGFENVRKIVMKFFFYIFILSLHIFIVLVFSCDELNVSRVFQDSFIIVSRVFQKLVNSDSKLFQECF